MGKRAATSVAGAARKKPAASIQAEKCAEIAASLKEAKGLEGYPASLVDMLSSMASSSIGVYKDARHPHQQQVIDTIGTTLKAIASAKEANVAELKGKIDGKDADKAARAAKKDAAEAEQTGHKETLASKKEAYANAQTIKAEKATVLKEAKKAQKTGDAAYDNIAAEKDRLEKGLASLDACPLDRKSVSSLTVMASEYKVDKSLVESMHTALTKSAEARGTFDNVIMTTLKEAFTAKVGEKTGELSAAQPEKDARADAVAKAGDALKEAEAHEKGCADAVTEAEKAVHDGAAANKAAAKALSNWLPDVKNTMDGYDDAVNDLKAFQEGALAAFQELVDLETPPPEPEPMEEVVPEAAPAEATTAAEVAAEEQVPT